jgi:hypothetical protein
LACRLAAHEFSGNTVLSRRTKAQLVDARHQGDAENTRVFSAAMRGWETRHDSWRIASTAAADAVR